LSFEILNCAANIVKAGYPAMGGVKKRSLASMEKQQQSEGEQGGQAGQEEKKKGKGERAAPPQQQKRLTFLPPKMGDEEILKSLVPLKAITIYSASRVLGVNPSIASGLLLSLETKGLIRRAGGYSGHYVWSPAIKAG
jgi:small subunit ribosomal protein S25e